MGVIYLRLNSSVKGFEKLEIRYALVQIFFQYEPSHKKLYGGACLSTTQDNGSSDDESNFEKRLGMANILSVLLLKAL